MYHTYPQIYLCWKRGDVCLKCRYAASYVVYCGITIEAGAIVSERTRRMHNWIDNIDVITIIVLNRQQMMHKTK